MMNYEIIKRDWKLFKEKIADWQEAYIDKVNKEYVEILLAKDTNPSDKFWTLDERIKKDKKKAGVQIEMTKSNLLFNLCLLINEGAINLTDLAEFTEDLKEAVKLCCRL